MVSLRKMLPVMMLVAMAFSQGCGVSVNGSQPMMLGPGSPQATSALAGPLTSALPLAPASTAANSLLGTAAGSPGAPVASSYTPSAGGSAIDSWQGGQLPPQQFFQMLLPAVQASSQQTGVPVAVTLAQAALETGYGRATVGSAKNLFGIHGTGPAGSVQAPDNGTIANFRAYNTWTESIVDHDRLLSQASRYGQAMADRANPEQFARDIANAGYATDPGYADKLIAIMRQYGLESMPNA